MSLCKVGRQVTAETASCSSLLSQAYMASERCLRSGCTTECAFVYPSQTSNGQVILHLRSAFYRVSSLYTIVGEAAETTPTSGQPKSPTANSTSGCTSVLDKLWVCGILQLYFHFTSVSEVFVNSGSQTNLKLASLSASGGSLIDLLIGAGLYGSLQNLEIMSGTKMRTTACAGAGRLLQAAGYIPLLLM